MPSTLPIKQINRNQIYRYIYKNQKVSQQDIATGLGLSMPTVGQNLSALRELGLIREAGTFDSTGGRKARAFCCEKEARIALGLDLTANHISLVAIDMEAHLLYSNRIRLRYTDSLFYYATLGKLVDSFIEENRLDRSRILGLGICLAAIIAKDHKTVQSARLIGAPRDLYQKLKPHISLPFRLFNDANSGGFAEWWNMEQERTIIYLSLSNSVGGAMVSSRRLYLGDNQKSCEFGHVTLIPDGRPCYCGQKGCLNAYCSANLLSDLTGGQLGDFFDRVEEKQAPYVAAFREYMNYLAIAVNNLRMQYDCDIILGGYVGPYMTDYLKVFREMVAKRNGFRESRQYVFTCRYRFETAAIGAALYYIDRFIRNI
ncbi:MAG: ROK family transcriptional regulator [Lachnospiraceae bacterium]|nr:ROK family transcriptional regulator [Lachnospiraceae bacterium]